MVILREDPSQERTREKGGSWIFDAGLDVRIIHEPSLAD